MPLLNSFFPGGSSKGRIFFDVLEYRVIVEWDESRKERNSEATVKLRVKDQIHHEVAESSGPVGALDQALRKALEKAYPCIKEVSLSDFKVRILDSAQGAESTIRVQIESTDGKEIWGTVGASDNIIEASWEALKDSVEYKLMKEGSPRRAGLGICRASLWCGSDPAERDPPANRCKSNLIGKGSPTLLKHYLKLNGTIVSFNVDDKFSHVLDSLILIDLLEVDRKLIRRYLGREGLEEYLRFQGV